MIRVQNVSKIFHEGTPKAFLALKDVSFDLQRGQTLILQGPSGSGKSTLLGLIASFYTPSSGQIIIDKTPISSLPEHFSAAFRRKNIGYIFQNFQLIPNLTLLENVLIPALPDKVDLSKRAKKLIQEFGLESKINAEASTLSGGEQQRTALIRALITDPQIILADEPTANLDATLSSILLENLTKMQQDGKTIIIATHDPLLLNWNAPKRIISLKDGSLV
jgi:putative ABC transport system ATP-binding protein